MKKVLTSMLAIALCASLCTAFAYSTGTSYADISLNSSGEYGPDYEMSGTVRVIGSQRSDATNTLYIAIQRKGSTIIGGDVFTTSCGAGASVDSTYNLNETGRQYHVLLDPSGPNATGCHGYGQVG